MKRSATLSATAIAAAVLAACATTSPPPAELSNARSVVRQVESDPIVVTNAPLELKRATEALQRANHLHADGDALAEVVSAAYVAEREARAALALAQAKRAEEAIKTAQAERERFRADVKALEARRAREEAALAQQQAAAAKNQAAIALDQVAIAQEQARAARQQAASAEQVALQARQESALLQQYLVELRATETARGLLVTLGDVLFEFNRAEIKPGAQSSLRKLADFLKQYPDRVLLIEGHTDDVGSDSYNQTLSQRRAQAVAQALIALGVAPERIRAVGHGESYPVADNTTDTNRALNRRVEVYISPSGQPVPSRG